MSYGVWFRYPVLKMLPSARGKKRNSFLNFGFMTCTSLVVSFCPVLVSVIEVEAPFLSPREHQPGGDSLPKVVLARELLQGVPCGILRFGQSGVAPGQ